MMLVRYVTYYVMLLIKIIIIRIYAYLRSLIITLSLRVKRTDDGFLFHFLAFSQHRSSFIIYHHIYKYVYHVINYLLNNTYYPRSSLCFSFLPFTERAKVMS